MTAKKKAIELVGRFSEYSFLGFNAKQCALICVDVVLKESNLYEFGHPILLRERTEIWQQVKEEIKKLPQKPKLTE